jgi:crotonobetainyl-CoA:carnitine CoA-transferase CaiB-like acyl-CoA transferase
MEAVVAMLGDSLLDRQTPGSLLPLGNVHRHFFPYGAHRVQGDDCWVAISCASDDQREALWKIIGRPGRAPEDREEFGRAVDFWCEPRQAGEVEAVLRRNGIAATRVRSPADAVEHAVHTRTLLKYDGIVYPRLCWSDRISDSLRPVAPAVGEHTAEILGEWLSADASAIGAWTREGAFA